MILVNLPIVTVVLDLFDEKINFLMKHNNFNKLIQTYEHTKGRKMRYFVILSTMVTGLFAQNIFTNPETEWTYEQATQLPLSAVAPGS